MYGFAIDNKKMDLVEGWNDARESAVRKASEEKLIPYFEQEVHLKLTEEAKTCILEKSMTRTATLREDLLQELITDNVLTRRPLVAIRDNKAAKVYMNSKTAMGEVRVMTIAYPTDDNEASFGFMVNQDGSVVDYVRIVHFMKRGFGVGYLQRLKDELSRALARVMINKVNLIGVDVNKCLEFPNITNVLQFVAGLGPRKAAHLIKIIKQHDNLLESRTKLVTLCRMGPKVQINGLIWCKIIKLDTEKFSCLLSSRTSDLQQEDAGMMDDKWDYEAEQEDKAKDEIAKQQKKKATETKWIKRVIQHPNFYNMNFADADDMLSKADQDLLQELITDNVLTRRPLVAIRDNKAAKVYMNSKTAMSSVNLLRKSAGLDGRDPLRDITNVTSNDVVPNVQVPVAQAQGQGQEEQAGPVVEPVEQQAVESDDESDNEVDEEDVERVENLMEFYEDYINLAENPQNFDNNEQDWQEQREDEQDRQEDQEGNEEQDHQ